MNILLFTHVKANAQSWGLLKLMLMVPPWVTYEGQLDFLVHPSLSLFHSLTPHTYNLPILLKGALTSASYSTFPALSITKYFKHVSIHAQALTLPYT